jgi:hypothetical protein
MQIGNLEYPPWLRSVRLSGGFVATVLPFSLISRGRHGNKILKTLSFRWLQALLGILISIRVTGRFFLGPSFFVPDESTWSRLTEWITSGGDKTTFEGFDRSPYYGAQALIIPSSFQVEHLDISSLDAVRNTSMLYGIGCLFTLYKILRERVREISAEKNFYSPRILALTSICLVTYALLPSHFLWSILGLRDSAAEFFVLLTFYFIQKSIYANRWRFACVPLLLISTVLVYSARIQTGWIVSFILISFGLTSIFAKHRRLEFCIIGLSAFLLGTYVSQVPEKVTRQEIKISDGNSSITFVLEGGELTKTKSDGLSVKKSEGKIVFESTEASATQLNLLPSVEPSAESKLPSVEPSAESKDNPTAEAMLLGEVARLVSSGDVTALDPSLKVESSTTENLKPTVSQNLKAPAQRLTNLENERSAKRVNAQGVIDEVTCPFAATSQMSSLLCEIIRTPASLSTFLFRPFFWETPTSPEFRYASLENISWLVAFLLIALLLVKTRKSLSHFDFASLAFIFLFSVPASLTEGNFGTAVRHKSVVLWALIYLLFSTICQLRASATHQEVLGSKET